MLAQSSVANLCRPVQYISIAESRFYLPVTHLSDRNSFVFTITQGYTLQTVSSQAELSCTQTTFVCQIDIGTTLGGNTLHSDKNPTAMEIKPPAPPPPLH